MSSQLLVRHGQASWGAADYDVLSPLGHDQAAALGRSWAARGVRPDAVVRGALRRHDATAAGIRAGLGVDVPVEVDAGWDELDHVAILSEHGATAEGVTSENVFDAALTSWRDGAYDTAVESWGAFSDRVLAAADRALSRPGLTAVISSGGPIAVVAVTLLGGGALDPLLWRRLNRVVVNSSVTTVVAGRSGRSLLTFNEHAHLGARQVTYR